MKPKLTIGICTWNRCDLLTQTLKSVSQLIGIDSETETVELLVINNGSTDSTAEILSNFQSPCQFRYLLETRLGHTYARNRLVREAQGETILWTDDDVILDNDWLVEYQKVIHQKPEESFWGGPIHPKFLKRQPGWLKRNYKKLSGCFAHRDLGPDSVAINKNNLPYGANFAVRTEVCRNNPFNVRLGRRGKGCVGEDERDFLNRILDLGIRGSWIPAAKVTHLIPPDRMSLEYVSNYFAGQAEIQWLSGEAPDWPAEKLLSAARDHQLWFDIFRWTSPSSVWIEHLIKAAQFRRWAQLQNDN